MVRVRVGSVVGEATMVKVADVENGRRFFDDRAGGWSSANYVITAQVTCTADASETPDTFYKY